MNKLIFLVGFLALTQATLDICGFHDTTCTRKDIFNCTRHNHLPPSCWDGTQYNPPEMTTIGEYDCCPSCMPFNCSCILDLQPCKSIADLKVGPYNCPSCIPQRHCPTNCTEPIGSIRSCQIGEMPMRNFTNCCPTCIPRFNGCANMSKIMNCRDTLNSLPICDETSTGTIFSREDCCTASDSCVCPRNFTKKVCSLDELITCLKDSPDCQDYERPCFLPDRCCPTCRGNLWRDRPEAVARCLSDRRECADGETATQPTSETCQTCVHPLPLCDLSCAPNEMCVFTWDFYEDRPKKPLESKCVKKSVIVYKIISENIDIEDVVKSLDNKGLRHLVLQIIERYCEIPQFSDICDAVKANFKNIVVERRSDGSSVLSIPDDFIQRPDNGPKRSLEQITASTIVSDAVQSPAAASGFTATQVTDTPVPTPTPTPTSNGNGPFTPPNSQPPSVSFFVSFALFGVLATLLFVF